MQTAIGIQRTYWRPDAAEKKRLWNLGLGRLSWDQKLRLLHLVCLEVLSDGAGKSQLMSREIEPGNLPAGPRHDLIVRLLRDLESDQSPYRARHVMVWQGKPGDAERRDPDMTGILRNASWTHPGCLEVIRLDARQQPVKIAFIPLDELRGAGFASPALFRYGKLLYDDGRPDEIVLLPLLYGVSWGTPNDFDRDGTMTRFICSLQLPGSTNSVSVGVGHQDFVIEDKGQILFGFGTVGEISVALSIGDPKFDQKCRVRGIDPEAVRKSVGNK